MSRTDRLSVSLSDGYLNLAVLYRRREERPGLHHFGFYVPSNREMQRLAAQAGVLPGGARPDRIPYAEYRLHDPEGNGIDISEKSWEV